MTEYREVPEFPAYRVGDDGTVWTRWRRVGLKDRRGTRFVLGNQWKPLRPAIRGGYRAVVLYPAEGRSRMVNVPVLVLTAFVGPCPPGLEACHENGTRTDDRLSNLRWDTKKANAADRKRHGRQPCGEDAPAAKTTSEGVREVRRLRTEGLYYHEIAERCGLSKSEVFRIGKRKAWAHVD